MFEEETIGGILETRARENGARPLVHFRHRVASYELVNEKANRVANWFLSAGFRKGDKVAILLDNCLEWLYVWFGLAKIGVVSVALNTHHRASLLQYLINHSDARLMVIGKDLVDRIRSIEGVLTTLSTLVVYPNDHGCSDLALDTVSLPEILAGSPVSPDCDVANCDDLMMLYTTDSTGPSQGVVSPHGQYVRCGEQRASLVKMTPDDVFYCVSPLYHIVPLGDILVASLIGDASMVLSDRAGARKFWWDVRRYRATLSVVWGTMMERLYMQPPRDDDPDNTLRLLLSPHAPAAIHEAFEKRFNLVVADGYGMTEVDPVIACTAEERKIGSPGKAVGDLDVKILDERDNELSPGEIGEIVCRPRRPHMMMKGYYKMPHKTRERWRNSWFHTDDYGYQDEDGYFFFAGAKNDGIKWRGENVSPFEVEQILVSHPDILESAVVRVPSEHGGDEAKAVVQLREGRTLTPEQLMAFCEQQMAFFMVPRYVDFVDELPKTEAGEVLKSDLRAITDRTWDRQEAGYEVKRD